MDDGGDKWDEGGVIEIVERVTLAAREAVRSAPRRAERR
jgi:hypothetical protein